MRTKLLSVLLFNVFFAFGTYAAPIVKITTSPVAAASYNQGTTGVLVYAVKMKVNSAAVTINNVQYTLSGTHDANDLTNTYVYYNTTPTLTGASYLGGAAATYAAPHAYSVNVYKPMNIGDSGYFLITVNVSATATDNKTVVLNGNSTPVTFGYSTSVTLTSTQTNGSTQTIQAADVVLSNSAVAASDVNQGTTGVLVYIVKMKVTTEPVVVNNIQYTLSGTHDANDLTNTYVYYNTTPTLTGASYLGGAAATYAGPHAYSVGMYKPLNAGDVGYFMITVNISATASDNKNIKITGATTPATFGFTTAPNVTGTQKNAGTQTIQAADIQLATSPVAASTVNQGATGVLVYAVRMKVTGEPVVVNSIQYTLSGTHDANDLTNTYVYYNTTPTLTGATYLGGSAATYAGPHAYSVGMYKPLNAGDIGYFLITVNVSTSATDNKNIRVTGNTTPASFGFTTAPNVTGNQNNGGVQTIQAADVKLSNSAVAASDVNQGATGVLVYALKMDVTTEPVVVNNIQYTLSGNHDANDLTNTYVYFNTTPSLTGASYLGGSAATYAAPHAYSVGLYKPLNTGESGYFLVTVNVSSSADDNKTIRVTGNTTPATFGFTTVPNVTGNQGNGGTQTIQAADITLTTSTVAAGNIAQGSTGNIVYAVRMNVATEPVVVNNIQYTLSGTHDADDLTNTYLYYNASTPSLTGASYLGGATATYAAPHTYSFNLYSPQAVGNNGYFLITVNVNAAASLNKTVNINGATNPVTFAYTTVPNTTNNQTNKAGAQKIVASFNIAGNESELNTEKLATGGTLIARLIENPVKNKARLMIQAEKAEDAMISISNNSGKIITTKNIHLSAGSNQADADVSRLIPGTYYLTLNTTSGITRTLRIIK